MFGALAVGETTVEGLLEGEDVLRTAQAMRQLGATVERKGAASAASASLTTCSTWAMQGPGHGC
jgi:5-enolpyruvylshikimate-3-phosphate synthase